jgi:glycine dehydrogenase subunit 1
MRCPDSRAVNDKLRKEGIVGGYDVSLDYPELENALLFCATEMLAKEDMDEVANIVA